MTQLIPYWKRNELSTFIDVFEHDMNRLMNSIFDSTFTVSSKFNFPKLNLTEENDRFTVEAAIPGYNKDDIKVEVKKYEQQQYLVITGKTSTVKEEEKSKKYHCREIKQSAFTRSVLLTKNVLDDKIEATFKDGILSVVIPKKEVTEEHKDCTKTIEIK
jgi:HSP20 family protein